MLPKADRWVFRVYDRQANEHEPLAASITRMDGNGLVFVLVAGQWAPADRTRYRIKANPALLKEGVIP